MLIFQVLVLYGENRSDKVKIPLTINRLAGPWAKSLIYIGILKAKLLILKGNLMPGGFLLLCIDQMGSEYP